MTKISPNAADGFCKTAPRSAQFALLYGPDRGLVQERARLVRDAVFGTDYDPMNHVKFTASEIEADPIRLIDEARSLSLMGGPRLVEASGPDADLVGALTALIKDPGTLSAFILITADDLPTRSKLRGLAEKTDGFGAVACYTDDAKTIPVLIRQVLETDHGLTIGNDARQALASQLGGDRALTLAALEKLALYVRSGEVTLEDVEACATDAAALSLDRLLYAITAGDGAAADFEFDRQLRAGTDPNAVLALLRLHLKKFMTVGIGVSEGQPIGAAIGALRPPLFFKIKDTFAAQARHWPLDRSLKALDCVRDTLVRIRQTGAPVVALTRQCLFDVIALKKQS